MTQGIVRNSQVKVVELKEKDKQTKVSMTSRIPISEGNFRVSNLVRQSEVMTRARQFITCAHTHTCYDMWCFRVNMKWIKWSSHCRKGWDSLNSEIFKISPEVERFKHTDFSEHFC